MSAGGTPERRLRVGIILGSVRPERNGEAVARWVYDTARRRADAEYEFVDLKDRSLPQLDEPIPASAGRYSQEHTRAWAAKVASFDAFVFVTPEYNHSIPASLKNAIDFVYAEWNNKVAGFVSYGSAGGVRAVEHLRLVMAELQVATVRAQAALYLATDFENFRSFRPDPSREKALQTMLDQLLAWAAALRALRTGTPAKA
jgi:NAD(P)H-dependent FMN reductase